MPNRVAGHAEPAKLRTETRDYLRGTTIPNVRAVAKDLENAGEDVQDLLAAIAELEALLEEGPPAQPGPKSALAKA